MNFIWDKLGGLWPAVIGGERVSYASLRQQVLHFLNQRGIVPEEFSHFGVVVRSIDQSLAALWVLTGVNLEVAYRNWVEAYKVTVARGNLEGFELEFIEPAGESFFADALEARGDGLQHVSCRVENIERHLAKLSAAGVRLVDQSPRAGSHGKVAFTEPSEFAPLYLELTEPNERT